MSRKEVPRAGIFKAVLGGRLTNQQGAAALQLSRRQFQRQKKRFRVGGIGALRHGSRGQPSPRRLDAGVRAHVLALMTTTYRDFNDCHLTEKLGSSKR